jgi:hypothetical protein
MAKARAILIQHTAHICTRRISTVPSNVLSASVALVVFLQRRLAEALPKQVIYQGILPGGELQVAHPQ